MVSRGLTKFFSVLVVLMLIVTAVAGCSSSKDTSNNDQTEDTADAGDAVDQPSDEAAPEPVEEEPTYDFGGRTITVGATWDLTPQEGVSESGDRYIARLNDLQEKYNFQIAYKNIPWGEFAETFVSSTLAGEPFADISYAESTFFYPTFVVGGLVQPLSDLGVFDFNDEKWNKGVIDFATFNGKVYGMNTGRDDIRSVFFWNKTMFEREGLPNLYELQNNKTWTWDTFLDVAQKATKDLDGDGAVDQYGLSGVKTEWIMYATNNAKTVKFDGDKPRFAMADPEAIQALQFWQDLIVKHKVYDVPPDGASWDYGTQEFINGKSAMLATELWHWQMMKDNMQDEYGVVAPPMGPQADDYISYLNVFNAVVIPATTKNPKDVAVIWNAITEPDPENDPEAWKESLEIYATDQESIDTVAMLQDNHMSKYDVLQSVTPLWELSWGFMWQINSGNQTPQVAINEIAQQAQALVDDAFKVTQ